MYKFTKIDDDNTKLEYNEQEFMIKRNTEILTELQAVDFEARALLNKRLKDLGCTLEDMEYEKEEHGKKIINDSEVQKLLDICKKDAQFIKIKNIVKNIMHKGLEDIAIELGEKEFKGFINQFVAAVVGQTEIKPSQN